MEDVLDQRVGDDGQQDSVLKPEDQLKKKCSSLEWLLTVVFIRFDNRLLILGLYYKTFYSLNLQIFVIS